MAVDDATRRFYLAGAEFIEYPDDSRTMYLLIKTVAGALRQRASLAGFTGTARSAWTQKITGR